MRLTHIKLAGFKSFVDPTNIHVPGQLVAVIGPNGCGKSNVIDAVRWVLGEASAKQLRGQNMQDVIFNGANTRKPVSRAAVELVFDNSDHVLQGTWGQYGEISIKRTLNRQGDSAYFINQQQVRRKDITDLFLGTGVGARGYAVIEQGMISRIIEARPEDLRAYLEEAAGVSKYKERRKETEARLKDTHDNLARLQDLQTELERQMERLGRQAKVASRYQHLKVDLHHKQNLLALMRHDEAQAAEQAARVALAGLETEQAAISLSLTQVNEALYQQQLTEYEAQNNVNQIQTQWAMIREQLARLEEQIRHQQDTQKRLTRERLQADTQLAQLGQASQVATERLTQAQMVLTEKQLIVEEWALKVEEAQMQLPLLEDQVGQLDSAYASQGDEHNRLKRSLELNQQTQQHKRQQQQQLGKRQQALADELAALNVPAAAQVTAAQQQVEEAQYQYETLSELLQQSEDTLETIATNLQGAQARQQDLNAQQLRLSAQHDALAALLRSDHDAATPFWAEQGLSDAPALWQTIQVAPQWQQAVATYLGERLQARPASPTLLSAANEGDCPTVVLTQAGTAVEYAVATALRPFALLQHIQQQGEFAGPLNDWLGAVYCANSLAEALAQQPLLQGPQCWLTPEGHVISAHSVAIQGQNQADNQLVRQHQVTELHAALTQLAPECAQAAETVAQLQAQQAQQQQIQRQHKQQLQQLNDTLREANTQATKLLERANQTQLRQQHIQQEQAQNDGTLVELDVAIETLTFTLVELEEALYALGEDHQQTQTQRQTQQQALKQARAMVFEANRQLGLEQIAEQKLLQNIAQAEQELAHIASQHLALTQRQNELALDHDDAQQQEDQQQALLTLEQTQEAIQLQLQDAQSGLEQVRQQSQQLNAQQQQLSARQPQVQQAVQAQLLAQQEAKLQAERFLEELTAHAADMAALRAERGELTASPDELSAQIVELARLLEGLGAVNLAALEELEEAEQRALYYHTQSEDLQQAMAALTDAIAKIDDESKALFKETFDAVNDKVQQFFPTLFGGGEAKLEMVGDDLLNAGVSIMARPPGKKNSTIHLLSGGEKALTAMSLVFALFSLNPAPFCLLDEVDAPLDDANTSRFCQLVKEMSSNTQFLYISHNRLTMEMAEQLVGVTMQEKGVSRIVAVDIKQALSMREVGHGAAQ
ncbi:MAG: chromosome segregation protein SMC [Neisseriaceae bacterium]|nr:chromosome segregation protein SMC [Neisseriaceae bacterium]